MGYNKEDKFETSCSEDFKNCVGQAKRSFEEINKSCAEKLKDVSNQMLNDVLTKYGDKLDDTRKDMIKWAMEENNEQDSFLKNRDGKHGYVEEYFKRNVVSMPIDSKYFNGVDFVCSNNYFVSISDDGSTNGFGGIEIRYFRSEKPSEVCVGILERERLGFILPQYLEEAVRNNHTFTITKQILDKKNDLLYSIVYEKAKIIDFNEPEISYNSNTPRVFSVRFGSFQNCHYCYPMQENKENKNKEEKVLLND